MKPPRWCGTNPTRRSQASGVLAHAGADGPRVSWRGRTPLVQVPIDRRLVYFKCEYANPRAPSRIAGRSACLVPRLAGATEALEDSSGNAGARSRRTLRGRDPCPCLRSRYRLRRQTDADGCLRRRCRASAGSRSNAAASAAQAASTGPRTQVMRIFRTTLRYARPPLRSWSNFARLPAQSCFRRAGGLLLA